MFRCQPLCEFDGFLGGIAGKRRGVLDDFWRIGKIVERQKLKLAAKNCADFPDFVCVVCGNEQRRHTDTITSTGSNAICGTSWRLPVPI